ncbi:MAG: tRNA lysidine(34) synthetase TilS [Sphingomonadales bacterium]
MENAHAAVGPEEFQGLMEGIGLPPGSGPVAVAVSGGADSLTLAILAAGWGEAVALVFDHGLRAGSGDEAKQVVSWLEEREIPVHLFRWQGEKPGSNIEAAARMARYRALEDWCRSNGVGWLLVAHHMDDQAETVLMRLARGSGVDGLSAMAAVSAPLTRPDGPRICRPLLGIPKVRLVATLRALGQDWIEDPANSDPKYLRSRVRAFLKEGGIEGLSAERLSATADRMAPVRAYLDELTADFLKLTTRLDPLGYVEISRNFAGSTNRVIGLRGLARILTVVGGAPYQPRQAKLERLFGGMSKPDFKGATLGGCRIITDSAGPGRSLLVVREAEAIGDEVELEPGDSHFWDGRFVVSYIEGEGPLRLSALGEAGRLQLKTEQEAISEAHIPSQVLPVLPAFSDKAGLVAVPHLDYLKRPGPRFEVRLGEGRARWDLATD